MRDILKYHPSIQIINPLIVILKWNNTETTTQNIFSGGKISMIKRFLFSISLLVSNLAFAQTSEPDPYMWVTNGPVYSIAVDSNYTYIGGNFTFVGPNTGGGAKLTTSNSSPDLTFPQVNGRIITCISDGSDGWYIGGGFSKVGNYIRSGIAHINSDGTVDANWDPDPKNTVYSLAISGSDIYAGGNFTSIGGQTRHYIAKLNNTDGKADESWNPGANGRVNSIAISGSDIYVGGNFTSIGGRIRNKIAKLNNSDGQADINWNPNVSNNYVISVAISGSDIYVGGNFTSIGGQTRNRIAKLNNIDGKADVSWNPNANNTVYSIAISGNDIYAGGYFASIGGQTRNRIAKLNNSDGQADVNWNPNANNSFVFSVAISGSDIFVGGDFTSIGGQSMNHIAKLNDTDGKADISWNPNANNIVGSIAISGNDIYAGGYFTSIGGQTMNYIAKLNNSTGQLDNSWEPNANGPISSIAISGSDIYTGGQFTSIGGLSMKYIAKLNNTDGQADAYWNPDANGSVSAIATSESGDIYAGGSFTSIGGQARNRIAKLNSTDGQADALWNPNAGNDVNSIAISESGDIYTGGQFMSIGGQLMKYIARLNSTDGQADASWNPDANGNVNAILITGNDIYAGGSFTSIGGQARNRIAKLNSTDGQADALWNPNAGSDVNSIAISESGDIYAGGSFTSIGSQARNRIAKLNSTDGQADGSWNPDANSNINAIAITENDIYVGGDFIIMNNISQLYFAVFKNEILPPIVHFTNIWTGNPYLAMNVYVTSGIRDNQELLAGDEIGVFDNDNCVGSIVLKGPIQQGQYISIITSTDDPTTPEVDGFIEGHTINYRLWESGSRSEVDRVTANYIQGTDTFSSQGTVRVELTGLTTVTQEIDFTTGWNIFSRFTIPAQQDLLQILNPLVAAGTLIKTQDEEGKAIEQLPNIGWINDIGNWSSTEGYYLKSSSDITLTLTDPPIELPIDIPLSNGWNIISYPVQTEQDPIEVLDALITSDQLVKVQNEAGDAMEKLPDPEGWVNNIGNFKPDEGYYIKTNAATTLTINEPANVIPAAVLAESMEKKKADKIMRKLTAGHFTPVFTSNPYLAMNIYVTEASLSEGITLGANDEIGIFDGDVCVGSYLLTGPITSYLPIKASTDDPTTEEKDGFTPGNPIKYRFWLSSISQEIKDYEESYTKGDGKFSSQGTAVVGFINVLPVELSSFNAMLNENDITLRWETSTEVNNRGFEIEKKISQTSIIDNRWNKIGFVEGHGNSNSSKKYSFADKKLTGGGKFQYRLKQIDNDGRFKYSNVIEVKVTPNENSLLQNYPNPFNPVTNFKFQIVKPGLVTLKIYDILGKEVSTIVNEELEAGYYSYKWDASKLASGIYFYKINAGSYTEVKKMLMIK
jgi:Secretion system C-terminal sorting domain/Domain of unknown function (DUF5122) beta-propeller